MGKTTKRGRRKIYTIILVVIFLVGGIGSVLLLHTHNGPWDDRDAQVAPMNEQLNNLLKSYARRDIIYDYYGQLDHSCGVSGNGYPPTERKLVCGIKNDYNQPLQAVPVAALSQEERLKLFTQIQAIAEQTGYKLETYPNEKDIVGAVGEKQDCRFEVNYYEVGDPASRESAWWTKETPHLEYGLSCQYNGIELEKGSFQVRCSDVYAKRLPKGYHCES